MTKKPSAKKSVSTSIEPDKAPQAGSPYIFVSYASVDRDVVTKVMERFQRAGVSFRTSDEVPSGAPLQATIEQLIAGASASVAILPGEASRWVEAELQVARDMGKPVFAILGTDAEMPKALSDRQHIQLDDFLARPSAASSAMKRLLGG